MQHEEDIEYIDDETLEMINGFKRETHSLKISVKSQTNEEKEQNWFDKMTCFAKIAQVHWEKRCDAAWFRFV